MPDRAQMGPTPTWPVVTVTVGLIIILIVNDIRERVGAADFSEVELVCGFCRFEPWRLGVLLVVLALHALIIREYYRTGDAD